MNLMRLLRFTPTLVILGVMIYCAQMIEETMASRPPAPHAEAPAAVLARLGLDAVAGGGTEAVDLDAAADALAVRRLRDPFNLEPKSPGAPRGPGELKAAREDRHAEFVDHAVLGATFIQNKTRLAVINGKLYKQGQSVAGTGPGASALVVHAVKPHEVVLASGGETYAITYSDRLSGAKTAGGRRGGTARRGPAVRSAPAPDPQLALIRAILGSSLTNVLGLPPQPRAPRP